MEAQIANDTRGWIMCVVSGIACLAGSSIIFIDLLVRKIPSQRNFTIQDSNPFLAASLSLSFGVMLFSALYSMLPSSKDYLTKSRLTPTSAAWVLLVCFVGGFVGIQAVSRVLHGYIPSHVVDCDHSHETAQEQRHHRPGSHASNDKSHRHSHAPTESNHTNGNATEGTPLLPADHGVGSLPKSHITRSRVQSELPQRRPSMTQVHKKVVSFMKDTKNDCDEGGPCFGYSEPCGQGCLKNIVTKMPMGSRRPTFQRAFTAENAVPVRLDEEPVGSSSDSFRTLPSHSREASNEVSESDEEDLEAQHHHHVPENPFMSIGLQTSIAIALHKLPEGFLTFATNHANPELGFSVFMALFVHNISEGFSLALPLYLALGSRFKAMLWSSILGGLSQPLGAAFAALWFKVAGSKGLKPGSVVYGCMFAITAGIMVSVALSLFVESLSLNHNKNLCIAFAFVGMILMGFSNALTA